MTLRLVVMASNEWAAFDGLLASQRVDPLLLPPDRMLNLIYWWAIQGATEQAQIDKFDRHLWRPPKGVAPAKGSPWSPEAETAAFTSLAAAFGTGVSGKPREGNQDVP